MRTMEFRRVSTEELTPRKLKDFVDTGLLSTLKSLMFETNLILKGPKGSGKTLAFEQLAALEGMPLLRQECCEETSVRDLVGTYSMQGGDTFYQLGALTTAIDVANEMGACILVLEEINTLPPMTQKILNSLTDYRRAISVPKVGRVWRLEEGKGIWVCGTMNPNYSGTYDLNEDLKSRFEFVEVNYMPDDKERELLLKQYPTPPNALERKDIDLIINLAKLTRGKQMNYALSTRDLVAFVKNKLAIGREKALKLLEGKYDGENVKDFQAQVMSTFAVNLPSVKLY